MRGPAGGTLRRGGAPTSAGGPAVVFERQLGEGAAFVLGLGDRFAGDGVRVPECHLSEGDRARRVKKKNTGEQDQVGLASVCQEGGAGPAGRQREQGRGDVASHHWRLAKGHSRRVLGPTAWAAADGFALQQG